MVQSWAQTFCVGLVSPKMRRWVEAKRSLLARRKVRASAKAGIAKSSGRIDRRGTATTVDLAMAMMVSGWGSWSMTASSPKKSPGWVKNTPTSLPSMVKSTPCKRPSSKKSKCWGWAPLLTTTSRLLKLLSSLTLESSDKVTLGKALSKGKRCKMSTVTVIRAWGSDECSCEGPEGARTGPAGYFHLFLTKIGENSST